MPLRRHRAPATRGPSRRAPRPARSTLQDAERKADWYRSLHTGNSVLAVVFRAAVRRYVILLSKLCWKQLAACSCLWRPCLARDWLWLHCGETEPPGFLKTVAPLRCSAGSGWRSAKAEQSSTGARSTLKVSGIWTEPASGDRRENDSGPVTTNSLSLKERHRFQVHTHLRWI